MFCRYKVVIIFGIMNQEKLDKCPEVNIITNTEWVLQSSWIDYREGHSGNNRISSADYQLPKTPVYVFSGSTLNPKSILTAFMGWISHLIPVPALINISVVYMRLTEWQFVRLGSVLSWLLYNQLFVHSCLTPDPSTRSSQTHPMPLSSDHKRRNVIILIVITDIKSVSTLELFKE